MQKRYYMAPQTERLLEDIRLMKDFDVSSWANPAPVRRVPEV